MRLATVLAFFLASGPVFAQATPTRDWTRTATVIGGQASGVWIPDDSPYWVVADTDVSDLVVLAGVEVRAWPGVRITVHGSLSVQGTSAEPVLFGARFAGTGQRWSGLELDRTRAANDLTYLRVERAANSGLTIRDSVAMLDHCTLIDNRSPRSGGGLLAMCVTQDLTLSECVVTGNGAVESGGGLDVRLGLGSFAMSQSRIVGNTAVAARSTVASVLGGGLHVDQTQLVTLTDCRFSGNSADRARNLPTALGHAGGGGLSVRSAELRMTRCLVDQNTSIGVDTVGSFAGALGGGILMDLGNRPASLENCIVAGNGATVDAFSFNACAGLYVQTGVVAMTNSIVARNATLVGQFFTPLFGSASSGLFVAAGSVAARNCIVYHNNLAGSFSMWTPPTQHQVVGNDITIEYSDVQLGYGGLGNLDTNPRFVGTGSGYADFALAPLSPCVDAGDPAPIYDDVAFPPSLGGARNDMGANGGPLAGGWLTNW